MADAAFLRGVPVLAALADELLEQLAAEGKEVRFGPGEWILREGEEAECLYVVLSGRIEVIAEGPPETLIRTLRRGSVLGELALLSSGVRTASARARRESHLFALSRERFEALIREVPAFAVGLTRAMGAQLAASRAPAAVEKPPQTVAVMALEAAAPAHEVAALLVRALGRHGSVAELAPAPGRTAEEMTAALDRAEADADRVLLVPASDEEGREWSGFCLREADLVIAVSAGAPDSAVLASPDAYRGCELLVVGGRAAPGAIAALRPRETQVVLDPAELRGRVEATARRLSGRAVGVVLSGGGARAFAHLGVIDELHAAGVEIDRIGGVSLGSIVGAGIALGHDPDTIYELFRTGFIENNPTGDYTIPLFSMIRGRRTRELLRGMTGDRLIEELPRRYFCLSCDLVGRCSVVHRTGSLLDAVNASLSIPGVFPPMATEDGRVLVDGGVLDNLPVETMSRTGEGPVIAVDVTGRMGDFKRPARPGVARLSRPVRRYLTGNEAELPRLGETIVRTVTVGSIDTAEAARRHADLVIQPRVEGTGLLDWRQLDRMREAGREAARAALADTAGLESANGHAGSERKQRIR